MEFCFEGCEILAESVDPLVPRRSRPPSPPAKEKRGIKRDVAAKDPVAKDPVAKKPSEKRQVLEKGSASKSGHAEKRKGPAEDQSVKEAKKNKSVPTSASGKEAVSAPSSELQLASGSGGASTGARSVPQASDSGGFIWEHGLVEN